jgi:LytS/YehU family sensor histidine kinase
MAIMPHWVLAGQIAIFLVIAMSLIIAHRRNKKKKQVDDIKHRLQLSEFESRLLRSQMHPHFVFNALNSINNLILRDESEKASNYLVKFSQLLRRQLRFSTEQEISLEDELETVRLYLIVEELRFSESFTWSIEVDPLMNPNNLAVPPMILQPYVENAIWHGLLPKNGEKKIKIMVEDYSLNQILIRIQDNGIGMAASAELTPKYKEHRSFGMEMGERRLQLLNADGLSARVDVVHLNSQNNTPMGTEIKLYLPLRHIVPPINH